jgi:hypothetical protein
VPPGHKQCIALEPLFFYGLVCVATMSPPKPADPGRFAMGISLLLQSDSSPAEAAEADGPVAGCAPLSCGPVITFILELAPEGGAQRGQGLRMQATAEFMLHASKAGGGLHSSRSFWVAFEQLGADHLGRQLNWATLFGEHSPYARDGLLTINPVFRME